MFHNNVFFVGIFTHYAMLPNSVLNRLRHWFVYRLKVDGSLAKEN